MNMQIFDVLITQNRVDDFKTCLKNSNLNSHHRALLFEKCFVAANLEMVKIMSSKTNSSPDLLADLFLKSLEKPIDLKNKSMYDSIKDEHIIAKIDTIHIQRIAITQDKKFYDWFLDKFPLTVYKNFRAIATTCIPLQKNDYLEPFFNCKFDKSTIFNFCLHCIEFDNLSLTTQFLKSQIIFNPQVIKELQNQQQSLFDAYLVQKKQNEIAMANYHAYQKFKDPSYVIPTPKKTVNKEETINSIMQQQLGESFAHYLSEKIPEKTGDIKRKTKI